MDAQTMQQLAPWKTKAVAFGRGEIELFATGENQQRAAFRGTIEQARAAAAQLMDTAEQLLIVADVAQELQ